ncbi:MAG: GNAT family N-acetyltransferase [Anaerolineales bacterium]|nr:GNAT family N-acetyltransferase [Anaerolineales bacterium]
MTPPGFALQQLTDTDASVETPAFADLLIDAVAAGASVGYLPPLAPAEALAYWRSVQAARAAGERLVWAAWSGADLAGSVQLDLVQRPNGWHRAEVMKLLVHRRFRRRGLGRALMLAAEAAARALGRTTLVLDTLLGEPSEQLYAGLGWQKAGVIPQYARVADGSLQPTVVYYKLL